MGNIWLKESVNRIVAGKLICRLPIIPVDGSHGKMVGGIKKRVYPNGAHQQQMSTDK